jgi:hypothetical protein
VFSLGEGGGIGAGILLVAALMAGTFISANRIPAHVSKSEAAG